MIAHVNFLKRAAASLFISRCAWILWTGTAAALQSAAYGNMGPVTSWTQVKTFPDLLGCAAGRTQEVKNLLAKDPDAVARKEDLVASKKTVPGDEEMIVHTVTKFLCLPDKVAPPSS